ncbi:MULTISPECIES: MarR family transcriptional regulator [unclassified Mesorhizobium]|uniref:MarR family transcriptional regulator n=2 Tax=Mesorhizobium TaxID=68287 RepID=UPI000A02B684
MPSKRSMGRRRNLCAERCRAPLSRCDQSRPAGPANLVARETNLTPAAVTTLIDRLEKRGFVSRQPDPDDRRKVMVAAGKKTEELVRRCYHPIQRRAPHCWRIFGGRDAVFARLHRRGRSDAEGVDREAARQSKTGALREGIGGWSGATPVRFQLCTVKETLCPV